MSLEKMNYYKEQKAHRKENVAKEKRRKKTMRAAGYGISALVVIAICGAIGLTGYNAWKAQEAAKPDYSVTSQVIDDITGVTSMEEAEAAAESEAAEESAAETAAAEESAAEESAAETAAAEESAAE